MAESERQDSPSSRLRELLRRLLGDRLTSELHARRWARAMPSYVEGGGRPFELALIDRYVSSGDVCIDLGAHGGLWTYPMSCRVGAGGSVHAFEISSYYARTLGRALDLVGASNVVLHPFGLGDHDGEVDVVLADEEGNVLTGMTHVAAAHERPRRSERVAIRQLDHLLDETPSLGRTRFMKIDVEGSELAVFRGAQRFLSEVRPVIFCEVTIRQCLRNGHTRKDVLELLVAAGYDLHVYQKDGALREVTTDCDESKSDFLLLPR